VLERAGQRTVWRRQNDDWKATATATATATVQRQLSSMRIRRDLAARLWRLLGKRSGEGTTAGSQRRRARWFTLQRMASSMEATVEATATAPAGVREVCEPASAFSLRLVAD